MTVTTRGATAFYAVALASMVVSVNTSWRYFGDILHITNIGERAGMFAVLELALIACGVGMRTGVTHQGRPGPARFVAWSLCAVSAFMAWQIAGPLAGTARVLLGPVLGLVMLHLALGIEWRAHAGHQAGTWSRIAHELRERLLSRVGLADDQRDALTRTRHRAADRAARLSVTRHALLRQRRLGKALAAAGVAHDDALRDRMLAARAVLANVTGLRDLVQVSPWTGDTLSTDTDTLSADTDTLSADTDTLSADTDAVSVVEPTTPNSVSSQAVPSTGLPTPPVDPRVPSELAMCQSDAARVRYVLSRADTLLPGTGPASPAAVREYLTGLGFPVSLDNTRTTMRRSEHAVPTPTNIIAIARS